MKVVVQTVKVKVNMKCDSLALLDSASNTTFCTESLVNELGVKGSIVNYKLNTLNTVSESKQSMVVDLKVRSYDGESLLHLSDVHVVKQIPVDIPYVDLSKYPALNQLPIANDGHVKSVDILIGQDHAEALLPLDMKQGHKGEPFAVRTLFGWSLNGPIEMSSSESKRVVTHAICSSNDDDPVCPSEIETDVHNDKVSCSKDKQVTELWENNVKLVDAHSEHQVLCKSDNSFPKDDALVASRVNSPLVNSERQETTTPRMELQPAVLSVILCHLLLYVLILCGTILTVHVFWEADVVITRQCQQYSSEMEQLTSGASPPKSSSVSDLLSMLCNNGIMYVGEHLKYADLPSDRTHPIVKYKHPLNHDVTDMLPLTSNHMLLLPGRPPPVSGIFSQNDMYRDEWECAQHLSNQFWFRWLSVYLPGLLVLIIQQNKWHNKERNVQVGDLRTRSTALVRPVTRFV